MTIIKGSTQQTQTQTQTQQVQYAQTTFFDVKNIMTTTNPLSSIISLLGIGSSSSPGGLLPTANISSVNDILSRAQNFFANPSGFIAGVLPSALAGLNDSSISNKLISFVNNPTTFLNTYASSLFAPLNGLGLGLPPLIDNIYKQANTLNSLFYSMSTVPAAIASAFSGMAGGVANAFACAKGLVTSIAQVPQVFMSLMNSNIQDVANTMNGVATFIQSIASGPKTNLQLIVTAPKEFVRLMFKEGLRAVTQPLFDVMNLVNRIMSRFVYIFQYMSSGVMGAVGSDMAPGLATLSLPTLNWKKKYSTFGLGGGLGGSDEYSLEVTNNAFGSTGDPAFAALQSADSILPAECNILSSITGVESAFSGIISGVTNAFAPITTMFTFLGKTSSLVPSSSLYGLFGVKAPSSGSGQQVVTLQFTGGTGGNLQN